MMEEQQKNDTEAVKENSNKPPEREKGGSLYKSQPNPSATGWEKADVGKLKDAAAVMRRSTTGMDRPIGTKATTTTTTAPPPQAKDPAWTSSGKLRKREQKLLSNNPRFSELLDAWGIPSNEELIRAFDVAYRKPLNSHGSLYIFGEHLCFSNRSRSAKWAVNLNDIHKIEFKKGNHSPKKFVFLHFGDGASYGMHKFRGRTGRSRDEMVATVLLAWEHARGNKSVDLTQLRAAGTYALKHPLLKQLLEHHGSTDEEEDEEEHIDEPEPAKPVVATPSRTSEFWKKFGDPVLPPDQHDVFPEDLKTYQPANLERPDRELTFPVSLEKTWLLLFSDNSTLVADYQQKNSAYDLHATNWADKQHYFERDYGFKKPIQSRLMSGTCTVTQVQRACLLNASTLLHFGASTMLGVPKGDCFTLRSKYEITMIDADSVKIRYWAWTDWHKSGGLLKGPIGSGTARAAIDSFGTQMEYVRSKIPTTESVELGSSTDSLGNSLTSSSESVSHPVSQRAASSESKPTTTTAPPKVLGLSTLELILLGLVIFFLLTTCYYRSSANSLSMLVEELKVLVEKRG